MSAKELGQIHTVNYSTNLLGITEGATPFVLENYDLPGQLSLQLQRMIRAGNYFKTVGIDISLGVNHQLSEDLTISGEIRYYAPTRGRCEAFRSAFEAMAQQMKIQGISMRDNPLYDFRAPLNGSATASLTAFPNQATLNGTNGLVLNTTADGLGIFNVHNEGVRPIYEGSNVFSEGFRTLLDDSTPSGSRADFVLNDVAPYTGNEHFAETEYETIPFQIAFTTVNGENSTSTFQWRPDPALYLAVMCGQFQIVVNDMQTSANLTDTVDINVAFMVSGWKSIMGNPDKKKLSSKKTRK